jgi:hypothetical protein
MDRNDLACPEGLNELGRKAHSAIVAELERQEATHTGGCKAFYSPTEWRARGEDYGLKSVLIVVHDGGAHAAAFNWNYECYEVVEDMRKALEVVGCFVEQCTSWYSAVYKISGRYQMLRGAKEDIGKALVSLNNLMDTMCDRAAAQPDARFEHNKYNLEEVIDAIICAKDNLGKIEIPKE